MAKHEYRIGDKVQVSMIQPYGRQVGEVVDIVDADKAGGTGANPATIGVRFDDFMQYFPRNHIDCKVNEAS